MNKKTLILYKNTTDVLRYDVSIKSSALEIKHKGWKEHSSKVDYDVWVVTSGVMQIKINEEKYVLRRGDIFVFYPYVEYDAKCLSNSCSFIFIHFDFKSNLDMRALEQFGLNGFFDYIMIKNESDLFLNFLDVHERDKNLLHMSLKGYLITLLSKLIKIRKEMRASNNKNLSPSAKLLPALEYVAENINTQIKIKALADTVFLSEKYFCSLFKETYGLSPMKYITNFKLDRALEYLSEGPYTVKDVALILGYTDQFVFSKAFKKKFGEIGRAHV